MIITDVKTHLIELDFKIKIGSMPRFKASGLYTQIITDEGIEGWALSHWNLSNAAQKRFIDDFLAKVLINKDPCMTDAIYNDIYHMSNRIMFGIPQATSAVMIALMDNIGKATQQPINRLLGGRKQKVRAYASLFRVYKPKAAAGAVRSVVEAGGYDAVKLRIGQGIKKDEALLKAVRDEFPDIEIMVDSNSGYSSVIDALKIAKFCDKYGLDTSEFMDPIEIARLIVELSKAGENVCPDELIINRMGEK